MEKFMKRTKIRKVGEIYVHELNLILRVLVFCKETCVTNSLTSLNNRHNYSNKRCKNVNVNWTNTCVFCKQVCEIRISNQNTPIVPSTVL